jgi:hypothetical protein
VADGQLAPRWILRMTPVFDHYLSDGGERLKIGNTPRRPLEEPEREPQP